MRSHQRTTAKTASLNSHAMSKIVLKCQYPENTACLKLMMAFNTYALILKHNHIALIASLRMLMTLIMAIPSNPGNNHNGNYDDSKSCSHLIVIKVKAMKWIRNVRSEWQKERSTYKACTILRFIYYPAHDLESIHGRWTTTDLPGSWNEEKKERNVKKKGKRDEMKIQNQRMK